MATSLNVALILRLVDRLSAPARGAASGLRALGGATKPYGAGARAAAAATDRLTASAKAGTAADKVAAVGKRGAAAATTALTATTTAAQAATAALSQTQTAGAAAAAGLGEAQQAGARATEQAGRSAEVTARKFTLLERAQFRGRAAARMLGGELERLDRGMGTLAKISLATEGLDRVARTGEHLIGHSLGEAATFSSGMTGFGITAELSDKQMAPIRQAILDVSTRFALSPEQAQETFAFTRRSGVFTQPREIIAAGTEAAKFQKLAERMGSPVSGEEVAGGASSAVREYDFAATPQGVRRYFAMIDAAEKTGGGMKMSDLLQYSRSAGGLMRSFGAGNSAGLADVLAAQQVSMFLSHSGGQAGINVQDLLTTISHKMTVRRFKQEGVDLPAVIRGAQQKGLSPLVAFARLVMMMTAGKQGSDRQFAIGHLIGNQQAGQSLMALVQNMPKFNGYRARIAEGGAVGTYEGDVGRATSGPAAAFERYKAAQSRIAIAMGTILLPVASRVADVLERLATWVSTVTEKGNPLARMAVFAFVAFTGLAVATVLLGHAVIGIAAPILTLRFLLRAMPLASETAKGGLARLAGPLLRLPNLFVGAARGALSFSAALLTNPITWIVLGIVGVVVLLGLVIRKYWGPISAWVGGFFRGLAEGLKPLAPAFAPLAPVVRGVGSALNAIGGALGAAWRWFMQLIEPVHSTRAELHGYESAGEAAGRGLAGLLRIGARVVGFFMGAFDPANWIKLGFGVGQGLIHGLVSVIPAIGRTVMGLGDQVVGFFKARLGIHSPSTVFADLGRNIVEGLDQGIAAAAHRPIATAADMAGRVAAAAGAAFHGTDPKLGGGKLPRGLRQNNPGNLRSWGGASVIGGFAAFASAADGVRAMGRQLQLYQERHGLSTIAGIVRRWAPSRENDTGGYIGAVSRRTGFAANAVLNLHDPRVLASLMGAMIVQEQGRNPFGPDQLTAMLSAQPAAASSPAAAAGAGRGGVTHTHTGDVHQHFNIPAHYDVRKLAGELHRLSAQGRRAALHDGADA